MHDATGVRHIRMQACVQIPGGRVGGVRLLQRCFIVGVEEKQIARGDLREVASTGIHEKAAAVRRDGDAEMVRYRFGHAQSREPAESRGEVGALLLIVVWLAYRCHVPLLLLLSAALSAT